jgi:ubiquinone/menaquinone biosynthesis C-methylase UbiE
MNIAPLTGTTAHCSEEPRLRDTREAFDSVAADYDGPRGNNELIQDMRSEMWRCLDATFAPGSRLIDLGCGTGLDAVRMARCGHRVTATDWSPRMVERTRERAEHEALTDRVQALAIGAHELHRIEGQELFDGAYSNLGPLNCVPDLAALAAECARLVRPRGALVFTVIGRVCPWEMAYFGLKRNFPRIGVRFASGMVPVGMNRRIVWTRYYTPREFLRPFSRYFDVRHRRGLCVFAPPPYLVWMKSRWPRVYRGLGRLDRLAGGWPLLRSMGDHFLVVMTRKAKVARA